MYYIVYYSTVIIIVCVIVVADLEASGYPRDGARSCVLCFRFRFICVAFHLICSYFVYLVHLFGCSFTCLNLCKLCLSFILYVMFFIII